MWKLYAPSDVVIEFAVVLKFFTETSANSIKQCETYCSYCHDENKAAMCTVNYYTRTVISYQWEALDHLRVSP